MNREELKQYQQAKAKAYQAVFNSPEGEVILADLKRQFDASSLKRGKSGDLDALATFAACGRREVVLYIAKQAER